MEKIERSSFDEVQQRTVPTVTENSIPAEKRNGIFKIVSESISPKEFLTFSRNLMAMENSEIEDIEIKYRDYRTRTMVLLSLFEVRNNSLKKLLQVLKLIGRTDIVGKIKSL